MWMRMHEILIEHLLVYFRLLGAVLTASLDSIRDTAEIIGSSNDMVPYTW
jgi:hypothetical protein